MSKFRIKIETEKSGKKLYSAQCYGFLKWNNLTIDGYINGCYGSYKYDSIVFAERAIDARIKVLKEEDNKKIISVEYKYL